MFHNILQKLSPTHQGIVATAIGCILLFGAMGKLGILQDSLNIVTMIVGIYLLIWGFHKSNLLSKFTKR